jgi:prepilin peptidase CpaA
VRNVFDLLPCALIVVAVAVWTDLHNRRIPNALTIPALVFGLIAQGAIHGWAGLGLGALGMLVGGGLLLLPFIGGFTGAGDVKLMAALGVFVGPLVVLIVVLLATLVAGILGSVAAARRGVLGKAARGAARIGLGQGRPLASIGSLPFAVPIAVGTVLAGPFLELLIH